MGGGPPRTSSPSLFWNRGVLFLKTQTYLTSSGMFQDKGKMPYWLLEDRVSLLMGTPSGVCKKGTWDEATTQLLSVQEAVQSSDLGNPAWVQIPAVLLTSSVISSKLLNLSELVCLGYSSYSKSLDI